MVTKPGISPYRKAGAEFGDSCGSDPPLLHVLIHPAPLCSPAQHLGASKYGRDISRHRMSWTWNLWEPQKLTRPHLVENVLHWASFDASSLCHTRFRLSPKGPSCGPFGTMLA